MAQTQGKQVNPWWVAVINGMASYIDSCTIITSGVALVIYQNTYGLTDIQFGALSAALTFCIAIGSIFGGRLGEYKYYDMDQVIAAALERVEGLCQK